MRILHILLYSSIGGIETYTRDLFAALEGLDHENVLVFDGSPITGLEGAGRRVYQLPGLATQDRSLGAQAVTQLSGIMGQASPDVAYVHTILNSLVADAVLQALPTVYFAHNYAAFSPGGALLYERSDSVCHLKGVPNWRCLVNAYVRQCNTRRPALLWQTYRRTKATGAWARRVDAIVCGSQYVLRRHAENGFPADRMHVLHYPVPLPSGAQDGAPYGPPRDPIVLFVGRITPQKGLDYLIRAIPRIETPCTVVVAGDGYELPAIRALTDRLGVAERVQFLGALNRTAVQDLYRKAAVLAVPSVWPEPFGIIGPEAFSHGLPVVAFGVGGIPEWLDDGETGFLVPARDVNGLARRLDAVLGDPALARRLAARGRQVVTERFTLDRHVDGLLRVFQQAIAGRGATSSHPVPQPDEKKG